MCRTQTCVMDWVLGWVNRNTTVTFILLRGGVKHRMIGPRPLSQFVRLVPRHHCQFCLDPDYQRLHGDEPNIKPERPLCQA